MKTEPSKSPGPPIGLARFCSSLNELSPLAIAAVEGPFHILAYTNPAFCKLLDRKSEQLIGKPFCQVTHMGNDCVGLLDQVHRSGESAEHTEQADSAFWAYTLWPAIVGAQTVGIMIQITDATQFHTRMVALNEALLVGSVRQDELLQEAAFSNEQLRDEIIARKQAEEVLDRARTLLVEQAGRLEFAVSERTAELTAINKQLDAFVYTVAHDLRAPLRSMQGFASILVEECGTSLSETGRDFANRIAESARFMDSLLQDLLAFSRIAKEKVQLEPVDLEIACKSVVARLDNSIQQASGTVEIVGKARAVLAHGPTLWQVITNLIGNALKFARPGVPPTVRLRIEEQSNYVRLWVEDNGLGIPAAQCERIFQLFTRLNAGKFPGTGIGLAIVEKGVERMGGFCGVDSVVGEGSRFWIELKRA